MTSTPGGEVSRLETLIADLDAVVWEAEAATCRFTFVSPGVTVLLGYTPEEWLAEPDFWTDRIHPEDRDATVTELARSAAEGRTHDIEYRFPASDGRLVWLRQIGHAVRTRTGITKLLRGLMVDVTAQKSAEERYRRLVERLPAIVYTESALEDESTLVYVSPQIREILGRSPEEWLGSTDRWLQQIHPDDRERVREEDERAKVTGEPFVSEYRAVAADGRIVWFRDESVLLRDEEGKRLYWQGVMLEITERMRAEEQLREAEERYRTLVEQTPVVTYLDRPDPSDVTIYISPRVEEMLGYTQEEMTREVPLWPEILHPDDRERVLHESSRHDNTHDPYNAEYRLIAHDGRVVWVHDQSVLVHDEAGNPKYWHGAMVDITEQKRAEELEGALEAEREAAAQLRAVDEMKNTFLQAVAHDLRTPLAAILGLAVTLEREDLELGSTETKDLATRITVNARKLDRLVNDLLDLDRLGRDTVEPSLRLTDVGRLVADIVEESELAADRPVVVETERVEAEVDPSMLDRIVENLLANTARYTPPGTGVWVVVRPEAGGVLIAVEDAGPGVPVEFREAIFEAFRQGPGAPEHSPGVGVGLALVARFAELHGGRAWVEERQGGGASFRVFLPGSPPRD